MPAVARNELLKLRAKLSHMQGDSSRLLRREADAFRNLREQESMERAVRYDLPNVNTLLASHLGSWEERFGVDLEVDGIPLREQLIEQDRKWLQEQENERRQRRINRVQGISAMATKRKEARQRGAKSPRGWRPKIAADELRSISLL